MRSTALRRFRRPRIDLANAFYAAGAVLIAAGFYFVWPPAPLFWLGVCSLIAGLLKDGHNGTSRPVS